jgi:hypothetical protein
LLQNAKAKTKSLKKLKEVKVDFIPNINIEILEGRVFINGMSAGITDYQRPLVVSRDFDDNERIKIVEKAMSCLHKAFKSSSPSMWVHQIAELILVELLPGMKRIEEVIPNGYKADILWQTEIDLIVEVTGKNYQERYRDSKMKNVLFVNKYAFFELGNKIRLLSEEVDSSGVLEMIRKVNTQSGLVSEERLVSDRMMKHFSSIDVNLADLVSKTFKQHLLSEAKKVVRSREHNQKELIDKLESEIKKNHMLKTEYEVYSLPSDFSCRQSVDFKTNESLTIDLNRTLRFTHRITDSKLFSNVETCRVHRKSYESMMAYADEKVKTELQISRRANEIILIGNDELIGLINLKFKRSFGFELVEYIHKNRTRCRKLRPLNPVRSETDFRETMLNELPLDPDHVEVFTRFNVSKELISIFSSSRDVHEMRFKRRVSVALSIVRRCGKPVRINHWLTDQIYAETVICGELFKKDGGVAYVSYFRDGELTRTEKWRLSDVESYFVNSERALALTCSVDSMNVDLDTKRDMLRIYYRILNENSWGLSTFLKSLRYFSSGICMGNPDSSGSLIKSLESLEGYLIQKRSVKMIGDVLAKHHWSEGKTPIFGLDFCDVGFECFLVNLCPSSTYGHRKHFADTMMELRGELDNFRNHEAEIREMFNDVEQILIMSENRDINLSARIKNHWVMISELSEKTKGRFTFSPLTLLCFKDYIDEMVIPADIQETCPSTVELGTAKGSSSYCTNGGMMSIESINEISSLCGSNSTSHIAYKILESGMPDLTMRMFDKDQVGGNREISILNSGFRMLQSIPEGFAKRLGRAGDIDLLDDSYKVKTLTDSACGFLGEKVRKFLTADQTRWGPNFNTAMFGLLFLMFSKKTTEYYMPALVCFLSEFKIFEFDPTISRFKGLFTGYSTPGLVGRYHMGQGIFHYTSSFYHSLALRLITDTFRHHFNDNRDKVTLKISPFCTSDDVVVMMRATTSSDPMVDFRSSERMDTFYDFFDLSVKYFGIKTSTYKNIISTNMFEFNSIYISNEGVGSNELKFLYSLIQPSTSGNVYKDLITIFSIYDNAINSGCSDRNSKIISLCGILVKMRQWKCDLSRIKLPSERLIETGIEILEPFSSKTGLKFETNVKFKRRARIEGAASIPFIYKGVYAERMAAIEKMLGTRKPESFKSLLTFAKDEGTKIPEDSAFRKLHPDVERLSQEVLIFYIFQRMESIYDFKSDDQRVSVTSITDEETEPKLITYKILKMREAVDFSSKSFFFSLFPRQESISTLSDDEFYLHMNRNLPRYELADEVIKDYSELNLVEKLVRAETLGEELDLSSPRVVQMVFNKERVKIPYERKVRQWSNKISAYAKVMSLTACDQLKRVNLTKTTIVKDGSIRIAKSKFYYGTGDCLSEIEDTGNYEFFDTMKSRICECNTQEVYRMQELADILAEEEIRYRRKANERPFLNLLVGTNDPQIAEEESLSGHLYMPYESASQAWSEVRERFKEKGQIGNEMWISVAVPMEYVPYCSNYMFRKLIQVGILEDLKSKDIIYYDDIRKVISSRESIAHIDPHWKINSYITTFELHLSKIMKEKKFAYSGKENFLNQIFDEIENRKPIHYNWVGLMNTRFPHYFSVSPRSHSIIDDLTLIRELKPEKIIDFTRTQEVGTINPLYELREEEEETSVTDLDAQKSEAKSKSLGLELSGLASSKILSDAFAQMLEDDSEDSEDEIL